MDKLTNEKLNCSLAIALNTIGDLWTSLILRDLMIFGGTRRFEQLREGLGISRNVLTERLNTLLEQEIVRKTPVEEGAKRMEYKLSRKGWELAPMLLAAHQWCERWRLDPFNSALEFVDSETGEPIAPIGIFSASGKPLSAETIEARPRTEAATHYLNDLKSEAKSK